MKVCCKRGHPMIEGNLVYRRYGDRVKRACKKCHAMHQRAYEKRKRESTHGGAPMQVGSYWQEMAASLERQRRKAA